MFLTIVHLKKHGVFIKSKLRFSLVWNLCPAALWILILDHLQNAIFSCIGAISQQHVYFSQRKCKRHKTIFNEQLGVGIIRPVIIARGFKPFNHKLFAFQTICRNNLKSYISTSTTNDSTTDHSCQWQHPALETRRIFVWLSQKQSNILTTISN